MSGIRSEIWLSLFVLLAVGSCDFGGSEPEGPIMVRVNWSEAVDLDLLVDEEPAHRQGGSADRQAGGAETIEIPRGSGSYVIAVQNLSGHASARPLVTVEGVRDPERSVTATSEEPIELTGSVLPNARQDCWVACEIDAEKRSVRRIERWE